MLTWCIDNQQAIVTDKLYFYEVLNCWILNDLVFFYSSLVNENINWIEKFAIPVVSFFVKSVNGVLVWLFYPLDYRCI